MGTGKSAVARELGRCLGRPVVEMDAVIEEREGMPIRRIFSEKGEGYFRARERELVREIALSGGQIVAAGGGVVLDPRNVRDLGPNGLLICLTARLEVILKRVEKESHRPLLECGDRRTAIQDLLGARRRFYDAIGNRIDTSELSVSEVASRIIALLPDGDA